MNSTLARRRWFGAIAVLATTLAIAMPGVALAHSELETADPADGAVLTEQPSEIVLTFSAELRDNSSIKLIDPSGAQIGEAGVDPEDDTVMRLAIGELAMAPGTYEIRWTSVSTDGDVLNDTLTFELTTPPPTPSPTPEPTDAPTASPTASAPPHPSAAPSPSPSPAASADGSQTGSSADAIIPIVAAIVVIALLGGWLLRGRSRGRGPA